MNTRVCACAFVHGHGREWIIMSVRSSRFRHIMFDS